MYKYEIILIDKTLLVATSDYSVMFTVAQELTEKDCMFLHIGNVIVRKHLITTIREVKVDE